jgi:hypothetical protein
VKASELQYDKIYYHVYEGKSYLCGRFEKRLIHKHWAEVGFKCYDGFYSESGSQVFTNEYREATKGEKFILWLKGQLPPMID